jgi:uncharacterized protein YycO
MFNLGTVVITIGIRDAVESNVKFLDEMRSALSRYSKGDWGDLDEDDKQVNADALKYGSRLLGKYPTSCGSIYIITEWDRSVTTILFPDEY